MPRLCSWACKRCAGPIAHRGLGTFVRRSHQHTQPVPPYTRLHGRQAGAVCWPSEHSCDQLLWPTTSRAVFPTEWWSPAWGPLHGSHVQRHPSRYSPCVPYVGAWVLHVCDTQSTTCTPTAAAVLQVQLQHNCIMTMQHDSMMTHLLNTLAHVECTACAPTAAPQQAGRTACLNYLLGPQQTWRSAAASCT